MALYKKMITGDEDNILMILISNENTSMKLHPQLPMYRKLMFLSSIE